MTHRGLLLVCLVWTATAGCLRVGADATASRTSEGPDLRVSSGDPTALGQSGCTSQPWNAGTAFAAGVEVTHRGHGWRARWWTRGEEPGTTGQWGAWEDLGSCSAATPTPTPRPSGPTPTPQPSGPRRYVGYASTWNTSIYDLTTQNIPSYVTHLNLAFARPNTTYRRGSYEFDQAVAGFEFVEGATTNNGQKKFTPQQAQDLRKNIAALTARGTQVWVSVGGWAYSQGSAWTQFNADRVVDLALDLGASGVDIDWESSGSTCSKSPGAISCSKDGEIAGIITSLWNGRRGLKTSIAGWSTGAYYVIGSLFEEGKVQWGSPFGGTMYNVVKNHGNKMTFINLMSYDGGAYYDPREGYESYRAIYSGPINVGIEIAPEGAGGATLGAPRASGNGLRRRHAHGQKQHGVAVLQRGDPGEVRPEQGPSIGRHDDLAALERAGACVAPFRRGEREQRGPVHLPEPAAHRKLQRHDS